MRTVATLLALIALLVVGVGPVAADTTGGGNGTAATAFQDGGCTDNGDGTVTCSGTQLDAFKDKVSGDFVCYDEFWYTFDQDTGDQLSSSDSSGCAENTGNVTVDRLTSVDVASTDIALTTFSCDANDCIESDGGTTSIAATWTGVGKTFKSRSSSHSRDQSCVEVDQSKSTSRNATFDGPFDASFAQISVGTSSFRIRCK
jgi:hypothetical protein